MLTEAEDATTRNTLQSLGWVKRNLFCEYRMSIASLYTCLLVRTRLALTL